MNALAVGTALSVIHTDPLSLPKEPSGFWLLPTGHLRGEFLAMREAVCTRNGWGILEEVCMACGQIFEYDDARARHCPECRGL